MCPTNRGAKKKEKQKYTKSNLIHNSMPRDIKVYILTVLNCVRTVYCKISISKIIFMIRASK